jgi:hypothetical protein
VAALRRGGSFRTVARRFRISPTTAHRWFKRAGGLRLDRVDWQDRPRGNLRPSNRTTKAVERRVVAVRSWLKQHSALGEFGAAAVQCHLQREHFKPVPCTRTIERILGRYGLLTDHRRQRQSPPPAGWYLPELATGRVELDAFDFIEGLVIHQGPSVDVFNAISLYGSLAESWPATAWSTHQVLTVLPAHWQACGRPAFAQFDNDTRFQGPHTNVGRLGRVIHLCLCLGVVPVFTPPRETGFQAKIESFNHLWQAKVWQRFHFPGAARVRRQSKYFIAAHRQRHAVRIESAPWRNPCPTVVPRNFSDGRIIFLRRTNEAGALHLLRQTISVTKHWPHRLVRCELDPLSQQVQIYALRRRQPDVQPHLATRKLTMKIIPWYQL